MTISFLSFASECTEQEVRRAIKKMNTYFMSQLNRNKSSEEAAEAVIQEFRSHVQHSMPFNGRTEKVNSANKVRAKRDNFDVTASENESFRDASRHANFATGEQVSRNFDFIRCL